MIHYRIREIRKTEYSLLRDFLYDAIYQRDHKHPLPKEIVDQPELSVYIEGFGKTDDNCLVAEVDGRPVGAVWTRILSGPVKGFGSIDGSTPELAISLCEQYRGSGIGTALMKRMLQLLREKGYTQVSLSVQKDNRAVSLYQKVGFEPFAELEEEYLMLYKWAVD